MSAEQTAAAEMKAQQFIRKLVAQGLPKQGWTGDFWDEDDLPDGQMVLECTREGDGAKTVDETILLCWEGREFVKAEYRVYDRKKTIKNAAEALRIMAQTPARVQSGKKPAKLTGKTRKGQAAPDFTVMTDQEVLDALAGKTVTWRRGIDGIEESITIPSKTSYTEDAKGRMVERPNDITVSRVINFIGGSAGTKAYRALNVGRIISIS